MLATLALNEMEWLPKLYAQHANWPGLVSWVFVEAADAVYRQANVYAEAGLVSRESLSTDGTTDFLRELAGKDSRVIYLPHGVTENNADPANGKCAARNRYLEVADTVRPDFVLVLDADEFYTHRDQAEGLRLATLDPGRRDGYCFRYRHPWFPPYHQPVYEGLLPPYPVFFSQEVRGGFWAMQHCHLWRWSPGLRYSAFHMTPQTPDGVMLSQRMAKLEDLAYSPADGPECIHMAFASSKKLREAKHRYYAARGEAADRKRRWYVQSRESWSTWTPGATIPHGAEVVPYAGQVPEVFRPDPLPPPTGG